MTWVAVGVGGAALIGGVVSANASQNAAQTQANAAENAQGISQNEFNTITGQQSPYMQGGYGGLSNLESLLGVGPLTQGQAGATGGGLNNSNNGYQGIGLTYNPSGYGGSPMSYIQPYTGGLGGSGAPLSSVWSPQVSGAAGGQQIAQGAPGGYAGLTVPYASQSLAAPNTTGYGSLNTPFTQQGAYQPMAPFTADTFRQYSPAYNFQLQQGQQGVLNGDESSQGALSGAALKDLTSFNQNYANTAFNNAYNQYAGQYQNNFNDYQNAYSNAFNQYQTQQNNVYSRLASLAQLGQNAAANTGQQGTTLAGQQAQAAAAVGAYQAAGQVGVANAISGGLQNAGTLGALYAMNGGGGSPSNFDYNLGVGGTDTALPYLGG